ncbi:hypothetical protein [Runella sp.]|uniref:hypothetical protein n=1 Tax=Runella sp. TaxID=1960881 RepID=UPI00301733BF
MLDYLKTIPDLIKTIAQHPIPTLSIALVASLLFNVYLFLKPVPGQTGASDQTTQKRLVADPGSKSAASVIQAFIEGTVLPSVEATETAFNSNQGDLAAMKNYTMALEKMFHFVEETNRSVVSRGWLNRPLTEEEAETLKNLLASSWKVIQ